MCPHRTLDACEIVAPMASAITRTGTPCSCGRMSRRNALERAVVVPRERGFALLIWRARLRVAELAPPHRRGPTATAGAAIFRRLAADFARLARFSGLLAQTIND